MIKKGLTVGIILIATVLGCSNGVSPQVQQGQQGQQGGQQGQQGDQDVLKDGPTVAGSDIQFNINPNWTNAQARKAVSQGLRLLTEQSDGITKIYDDWYKTQSAAGRWDLMETAQRILDTQTNLRKAYGKDNIAAIKQADGIDGATKFLGHHTGAYYLTALYNASYMAATTNATPAELAAMQKNIDELSDMFVDWGLQEFPETNLVPYIKGKFLGGDGLNPNANPKDANQKIVQQIDDCGQFMAFADDLTRMGHTLDNLSNRSAGNFIITDNYKEAPSLGRTQLQQLAGITK